MGQRPVRARRRWATGSLRSPAEASALDLSAVSGLRTALREPTPGCRTLGVPPSRGRLDATACVRGRPPLPACELGSENLSPSYDGRPFRGMPWYHHRARRRRLDDRNKAGLSGRTALGDRSSRVRLRTYRSRPRAALQRRESRSSRMCQKGTRRTIKYRAMKIGGICDEPQINRRIEEQ